MAERKCSYSNDLAWRSRVEASILEAESVVAMALRIGDDADSSGAAVPHWVYVMDAHLRRVRAAFEGGEA